MTSFKPHSRTEAGTVCILWMRKGLLRGAQGLLLPWAGEGADLLLPVIRGAPGHGTCCPWWSRDLGGGAF